MTKGQKWVSAASAVLIIAVAASAYFLTRSETVYPSGTAWASWQWDTSEILKLCPYSTKPQQQQLTRAEARIVERAGRELMKIAHRHPDWNVNTIAPDPVLSPAFELRTNYETLVAHCGLMGLASDMGK